MTYAESVAADRRLLILKALRAANGYTASGMLLRAFLSSFGREVSSDLIAGELAWLAEMSLISLRAEAGQHIATITSRGLDVCQGVAQTPGVRRPEPGEL